MPEITRDCSLGYKAAKNFGTEVGVLEVAGSSGEISPGPNGESWPCAIVQLAPSLEGP